ncbi:MAG: lipoprotein [Pseudomonadota bacterium]
MKSSLALYIAVPLAAMLAGCGQTGPLYLPKTATKAPPDTRPGVARPGVARPEVARPGVAPATAPVPSTPPASQQ